MPHRGTETDFELTTIERLERLGYTHVHGEEITRPHAEVVLKDRLRAHLVSAYPELPAASIDDAVTRFSRPDGVDTPLRVICPRVQHGARRCHGECQQVGGRGFAVGYGHACRPVV